MDEPFFSIIIPTFNRAAFLPRTIESVVEQDYKNWECLIIDDGSTDNTKEVVSSFKDLRVNYFYKINEERSIARNYGINRAKGKYFCFLDSDDIFYPEHLKVLYERIKSDKFPIGLYHTNVIKKVNNKIVLENWFCGLEKLDIIKLLMQGKSLYIQGICLSREILYEEKFPSQFSYWEDQHLWIRIILKFPFFTVNKATVQWNVHPGSSVETNFKIKPKEKLSLYLACITDLSNQEVVKKSFLIKEKDFKNLKITKSSIFLNNKMDRREYIEAFLLYPTINKYVNFLAVNKIYFRLTKQHIKTYIKKFT